MSTKVSTVFSRSTKIAYENKVKTSKWKCLDCETNLALI